MQQIFSFKILPIHKISLYFYKKYDIIYSYLFVITVPKIKFCRKIPLKINLIKDADTKDSEKFISQQYWRQGLAVGRNNIIF